MSAGNDLARARARRALRLAEGAAISLDEAVQLLAVVGGRGGSEAYDRAREVMAQVVELGRQLQELALSTEISVEGSL